MSALPLFRLDLNDADRLLTAVYKPAQANSTATVIVPTLEHLIEALAQRGWSEDALDPAQANEFIERCQNARESVQSVIGAVHNGRYELSVAPNKMSVTLALSAPKGGHAVAQRVVRQALADLEIVYGVNEAALAEIFQRGYAEPTLIAQGTPPIRGTSTVFKSLLDSLQTHDHDFNDDSPVDYRSLGKILLVTPGTPLMERIPPNPGVDGFNVQGQALPAPEQPDTPFSDKLQGVAPDENNPNVLLATLAGQPLVVAHGVNVNPVLEVDEVNLSTGNIVFDGSLRVNGDITSGMTVRVSGDVVVQGTIEAAFVEAGGNITVNGGIIGTAETASFKTSGDAPRTARIHCSGEVKARFIENAVVDAQCSVNAQHQIRASRIASSNTVQVGPIGSRTGVIMGGVIRAWASVYAGTIGSPVGFATVVQAGLDPHADMRHAALEKKRAHLDEERAKLEKILSFLKANPNNANEQVKQRARSTYEKLMADLKTTEEERVKLHRDLIPLASASITALQRFCGGVTVQIGNRTLNFLEEKLGGKVCLDDEGELAIRSSTR